MMIQSGSFAAEQGPAIHSVRSSAQNYYVILGAIEKPGVYEFSGNTPHVSDLVKRAGKAGSLSSSVHIVRNGRPGLTVNLTPQNDPLLMNGDIVLIPGAIPEQKKSYVTLLNLIHRPVLLPIRKDAAKLDPLLQILGQSRESVHIVHALSSRKLSSESNSVLTTGSVLVFKPQLVNSGSIPRLTGYYPDPSKTQNSNRLADNPGSSHSDKKPLPNLPALPVPIQDPEVGIVNSEGTIGLPPAHADYQDELIPIDEDDGLKASSKVNRSEPQFPALAVPGIKNGNQSKTPAESGTVPPPPVDKVEHLVKLQESENPKQSTHKEPFEVSSTMIALVMIGAILLTGVLLGSMAMSKSGSAPKQQTTASLHKRTSDSKPVMATKPVIEVDKPVVTAPPIAKPNYIKSRKHKIDLEALIQDELLINEKKPVFSHMENLYGTPAGPRMIRIEQKQELKPPHYVREVRKSPKEQKVFAEVSDSTPSAVQEKIRAQIEARVKNEIEPTSDIKTELEPPQSGEPVKKKSVKMKKPTLELSIEQKLGMLDQVLSSVKKPEDQE